MTRRHLPAYTGATGRLRDMAAAARLGSGWMLQPKHDGVYAQVETDDTGAIVRLLSRVGREITTAAARSLLGVPILTQRAVLCAELEDGTEAGSSAHRAKGYADLHLFDALWIGHRDLSGMPYRERRDHLMRAHSRAQDEQPDYGRDWTNDRRRRAHGSDGRYTRCEPRSWRRARPVPQHPISALEAVWGDYVADGGMEGLVAVRQDAVVGARGCKRKLKPIDTADCRVVYLDEQNAGLALPTGKVALVQRGRFRDLRIGQFVELRHDGWYGSGLPRFPRIARVRSDLEPPTAACRIMAGLLAPFADATVCRGALLEW